MTRTIPAKNVRLKRAYEPPSRSDGTRVLVDRLWPRGVKKTDAKIDEWMKEIAPSAELRRWFNVDLRLVESTASSASIDTVRFTARFTNEPARVVVRELAKALGGTVEDAGQALVLHAPDAKP